MTITIDSTLEDLAVALNSGAFAPMFPIFYRIPDTARWPEAGAWIKGTKFMCALRTSTGVVRWVGFGESLVMALVDVIEKQGAAESGERVVCSHLKAAGVYLVPAGFDGCCVKCGRASTP